MLGAKYAFAFDPQWGYLTSLPDKRGNRYARKRHVASSGALHFRADGRGVAGGSKLGLTVRGLYGEGSEALGHLYQLSNQVTLGRSEEDVIRSLVAATEQIVGHDARGTRAYGEERYVVLAGYAPSLLGRRSKCRLMSAKELMRRYSDIRYAASMGYLHAPLRGLDKLMMDLQPGSLGVYSGKLIGEREGEILRAKLLGEKLRELVTN